MTLPALLGWPDVHSRLQEIFPEGSPNRAQCVWEIAAKTIFVMLYVGAIEDADIWLRPDQVTRMTDEQAAKAGGDDRDAWREDSMRSSRGDISGRWYAANTRESIRDDAIRSGLVANGVVIEREGLPTTSPLPRYALAREFSKLFDPALTGDALKSAIADWRGEHLSAGALARIAIVRGGAIAGGEHVMVTFPSGETRRMASGPSSVISKAVIEEFSSRFLEKPGVIFLSESGNKVVARDDALARATGLEIQPDRNLPDIILADLGPKHPLLIFVEVVATDGPITQQRKDALLELSIQANFPVEHVAFVTAFLDRSESAFKKAVDSLAWGSFAWFASEPVNLVQFHGEMSSKVSQL